MQLNELAPLFKLEERTCADDGIIDDGEEADRCYVLLQGYPIPHPHPHPHPHLHPITLPSPSPSPYS